MKSKNICFTFFCQLINQVKHVRIVVKFGCAALAAGEFPYGVGLPNVFGEISA